VPGYSVHDLSRIGASKKKLLWLVENKIFDLRDMPVDEIDLSDIQLNQVPVRKRGKPIIDHEGIRGELEGLQFPLYFLDYETFLPAIPLFSGYGRFDRVPFQFSLHILHRPGEVPEHVVWSKYRSWLFLLLDGNIEPIIDEIGPLSFLITLSAEQGIARWRQAFEDL
jgi:Domain of unknown function(DUF2779)